jgi:hypothetical protein
MTTDTLHLVEGHVQRETRDAVRVKGLSEEIPVYELTGATWRIANTSTLQRRVSHPWVPSP